MVKYYLIREVLEIYVLTNLTSCTSGSVVEYCLPKARVAGSNPVSCLIENDRKASKIKPSCFFVSRNHVQDVCNILLRTRIAIMLCPYRHDSLRLLIVFKLKLSTRQFIQITGNQRVPSLTIINGVIINGLQSPINVVSTHFLP